MTRVAIIGGCRTPFVKAGGVFAEYSFLDLGLHVVEETVTRCNIEPEKIDELIFSTVLLDPRTPNAARELLLRSGLPQTVPAHFISNNCISGLVALNMIAEGIQGGRITNGIAGGTESMSLPTLSLSKKAERFWIGLNKASRAGIPSMLSHLLTFRPSMIVPTPPSPKEPSTGLTMGQHCELSAKEFSVKRAAQDEISLESHQKAAQAQQKGYLAQEIAPLGGVDSDNIVRGDTSLEKLAKLRPVFDKSDAGTITAGSSSALTDGASAIYLMSESAAHSEGRDILGYIEGVEFAAIAPDDGLLMAPGIALPRLFRRLSLGLDDVDRFEIHEAFAAQVLSNMHVWEHGWEKYGVSPVGKIPSEKMNLNGGSIALGHPFAATGGRLVLSALHELQRSGNNRAVISVCAAGGMAAAVSLVRS